MTLPPLKILSVDEQHKTVMAQIKRVIDGGATEILDAGCGPRWYFPVPGAKYKLTGIDLDGQALEARKVQQNDLDEIIVGDLRNIEMPSNSYDVIYCAYVLEHIEGAEKVLEKFFRWLKPNGLLVLYIPDPDSVYCTLARLTPHFVHVLFYRYALGRPNAGKPGNAPYPAYYDDVVSRRGMRSFAAKHNLTIREEFGHYRQPGILGFVTDAVRWLSLFRLASSHCDLVFVLEKGREK